MAKAKKIRDVVYGFVTLDEHEQVIIDHPAFQRLRRIKQLSLTDMLYPGATHSRFEHSIGVMQMASDMFDSIVAKDENQRILEEHLSIDSDCLKYYRKIVRLAALLHDVGHAPFSHPGEEIMPLLPEGYISQYEGLSFDPNTPEKRYRHEEYSIITIKEKFATLIKNKFHLFALKMLRLSWVIKQLKGMPYCCFGKDLSRARLTQTVPIICCVTPSI